MISNYDDTKNYREALFINRGDEISEVFVRCGLDGGLGLRERIIPNTKGGREIVLHTVC